MRNWKHCTVADILAILAVVLVFTACSGEKEKTDPDNVPKCECPNGTVHTDAPCSCNAAGSGCTCTYEPGEETPSGVLLYQGHGSIRITTPEGKVIYIDPYADKGYDVPADLILVTHGHSDHNAINLIQTKNQGCVTITNVEALVSGDHKIFDLDYVTVEAVQAGNNPNHNINVCVGYILTFSDNKSVYISGDTSTTAQMATFAERNLDYAFFCCDGNFNMDTTEASACAALVRAKNSIPYHILPGQLFNREKAELFQAEGRLIVAAGEEIEIK